MTKILVLRYRFIGDTILTIPFLRNLRNAYPDAQIDMLVGPMSGEILEDCPYIDNLIYFDTTRKHRYENSAQKKKNLFSYAKELRATKYDKAYVLKRSLSSAFLAFLAGIPKRIGFDTEKRGFLLTKKVPYTKDKHEIESFLDVLRADNVPVNDSYLENWHNCEAQKKIDSIFEENSINNDRPKIILHATSGNINKQWPLEYFARVVDYLANEKGLQVFYAGAPADFAVYEEIHTLLNKDLNIKPLNLCGKLSLQESAELISRMDLMVGCDSGNLHIASSYNVPVIGIYGPMSSIKWGAWGDNNTYIVENLPCVPCELKKKCTLDRACLKNIKPERIIKAIESKLNSTVY